MNKTTNWILGGVLGISGLAIGLSSFLGTQGDLQMGFITQGFTGSNGTGSNGSGTNGSGIIRYGCAIFTGSYKTCIEMQNGPFTEPSCNNSCNTPPVKYKVCTNYQCAWSDKNDGSICDTSEIGASCKPDKPTIPVKEDK